MVKVHKPVPKTIKKDGTELKKIQKKVLKTNTAKEVGKKVKKTLGMVNTNKVGNVKTKRADLTKENGLLEKIDETVSKKKPLLKKSIKNGDAKNPHTLQEVPKPLKKVGQKKKVAVAKTKQTVQNFAVTEEKPTELKNSAPKKKAVEAKVIKKPVAKKSSTLEEEAEKIEKDLSKKKQLVPKLSETVKPKVQLMVKKTAEKKNLPLEKKSEKDKKIPSQKKLIVAKEQPCKKSIAKNKSTVVEVSEIVKDFVPKKKSVTAEGHETEVKIRKKPLVLKAESEIGKLGQKKSKIQKTLSTKKKNKTNLKNTVQKNVDEGKKINGKEQSELIESEEDDLPIYEREVFDENRFKDIVSLENIKKISKALKVLVEKEVSAKKTAIFSDFKYFLNVVCFKIPNCPKRMVKLDLKHSLVDTDIDDVLLIVPDLKLGAKVDYEPTIQHFDDILQQHDIKNIKVMPFNQLRNEYSSFEAKRKLANSYDHFLCDGRIVGHVASFCGKPFQKPRTTIHAVNLSNPRNFKNQIECGLKRTSYRQLQRGSLISVLIGNHRYTADKLAENIEKVVEQLKSLYPGGYPNIRSLHIRIDISGTSSLPLYQSMAGPPEEVPNIIGPREEKMIKLKKQANEILTQFNMSKTGEFVKLNKEQIKRKQEIRKAREALTSNENIDEDQAVSELNPPLKKKLKKQIEPENSDENGEASDENVEVSEEESDNNDEDDQICEASDQDVEGSEEENEENETASDEDIEVSEEENENDDDGEEGDDSEDEDDDE